MMVAPGLGDAGNPAPLARPYLVPTRDWGVVVDTASVPETNLADSRSQRIRIQPLAIIDATIFS